MENSAGRDEAMEQFKCDGETRALQLEKEIWKLIDEGKLQLEHGTYGFRDGDSCRACALGSAARVVCGLMAMRGDDAYMTPIQMRDALAARGVASTRETLLMEMGFEWFDKGWLEGRRQWSREWTVDFNDPFYRLGIRLRGRQRPQGGA